MTHTFEYLELLLCFWLAHSLHQSSYRGILNWVFSVCRWTRVWVQEYVSILTLYLFLTQSCVAKHLTYKCIIHSYRMTVKSVSIVEVISVDSYKISFFHIYSFFYILFTFLSSIFKLCCIPIHVKMNSVITALKSVILGGKLPVLCSQIAIYGEQLLVCRML